MKKAKVFQRKRESSTKKFNPRKDRDKLYNKVWSIYSKVFLAVNKLCYACGAKSQVTDHLIPHKGDEELFKKLDNHVPLCAPCHNFITASFDRFDPPKYEEKLKWMSEKRAKLSLTFSVKVLPRYGPRK